jgi:hypothetical protein
MSKKIISYSLYGQNRIYLDGAMINAKDKLSTYGPEWETWIYVYEDVPKDYVDELQQYADRIIPIKKDFYIKHGMFWRFLPIFDKEVEYLIVRDLDSRTTQKEVLCVNDWLKSNKQFHIIRDGITHQMPFMGCSFGFKNPLPFDFQTLLDKNKHFWNNNAYNRDQLFLAHCIYPLTVNNRMVHDSFNHYELDGFNHLERTERFIGEKILEKGIPDNTLELENMSNRYLYFHRNIDLYNTEQFGGFVYEFMENLQIARKLGRTLVIPNVLIAPRNNKKILSEKHIYIKSLSLVPITNYFDLSQIDMRYVKLLPLAEFYEKTYNNPATILYNPKRIMINEYIIDKKLLTPFGKMNIDNTQIINEFGLNILSDKNIFMHYNTQNLIIIENSRLGQPNWHDERLGLDYFLIRMGLIYHNRLQQIANEFILENKIRIIPTLMVHWRKGDRTLETNDLGIKYSKYEGDTLNYFDSYNLANKPLNLLVNILTIKQKNMEIQQLFLVHNNADDTELDFINKELKNFNIRVIEYKNTDEQDEAVIQQLIGAQCKYQLHGPSSYERMSAFGRLIIEERKRYYFNDQYITTMNVFNNVFFIE